VILSIYYDTADDTFFSVLQDELDNQRRSVAVAMVENKASLRAGVRVISHVEIKNVSPVPVMSLRTF